MEEIRKVFSYAEEYKSKIYVAVVLATLSVLMGIIPYYLVSKLMASFLGEASATITFILRIAGFIFLGLFLKALFFSAAMKYSHQAAFDTLLGMRNKLADKMIKMPMGEINKKSSGQFKQIFVDLTEDMEAILAHLIPEGISNTVVPLAVMIYLFVIDWRMALLTLAIVPIALYFFSLMMKGRLKKLRGYLQASQSMNSNIVEFIKGMEVIKIFNQTTSSFEKYANSVTNYKKFVIDWSHVSWPYMAAFYAVVPCTVLFSLPIGALFLMQGSLTMEAYILCLLLALSLGSPLLRLTEFGITFQMVTQKSRIIDDILAKDELVERDNSLRPASHDISFNQVSFAYEQKEVIRDVSFMAKENTVTALVGQSGSGKSTLAKLLVRFWDVQKGKITIGGIDIKDMSFQVLMDSISYVSQDIHLFNTSIMENIRIGRPEATDDEVIKTAKIAQCQDFVMATEQGYHTNIGEAGDKLSGGEKQRISIARALLKNAPIVILDEATAFTDPENEDKIQAALNGLLHGKTIIVIAHRLSTITEADNIILLDEGKIAAQGIHRYLTRKSELYRLMWQAHSESIDWDLQVKEGTANA